MKMLEPAISVVIPVYNNGPYIVAAVDSVLGQTRPATEIVVVDDGSTDWTSKALVPYRQHIKYVYQKNRGEPAARNRGIQESNCNYIAFLDGDDLWEPNKLELQIEYLKAHPECALVYTDMSTFNENGIIDPSVKERLRMQLPTGRIFANLIARPHFGSGTVMVRRECFHEVGGFDETLLVGSDYEMWLRIAYQFEIGVVDSPLLKYRHHAAMSTRGTGVRMSNGVPWEVVVITKALGLHPEAIKEIGEGVVEQRIARSYADMAVRYFRVGEYKEARRLLRTAASHRRLDATSWILYILTFFQPSQVAIGRTLYRQLRT